MKNNEAYCDTDTLFSNAVRHQEAKSQAEASAIRSLMAKHSQGTVRLFRSNVVRRELEKTRDAGQRDNLRTEFLDLVPVINDEKHLGFHFQETDPFGGSESYPLVSDVQDEGLCERLEQLLKLPKYDAQHLAQAISNNLGAFITRDEEHFLHQAQAIEAQVGIKVCRPSEFLANN